MMSLIQNNEKSMLRYWLWCCTAQEYLCLITRVQEAQCLKGESIGLLVKYSVLNLSLVLAHMQFPILYHYIPKSRHRKGSI